MLCVTKAPESPLLYSWDVEAFGQGPRIRHGGVTDDRHLACLNMYQVLRNSPPGTHGTVHRVALDPLRPTRYVNLGDTGEAWHDIDTGGIVWTDEPPNHSRLDLSLAQARAAIQATPPEQHAAWWAAFRSREGGS